MKEILIAVPSEIGVDIITIDERDLDLYPNAQVLSEENAQEVIETMEIRKTFKINLVD